MTKCSLCNEVLKAVFPGRNRRRGDCQFTDCLHVVLGGGYGEFVDGSVTLVLCKTCAERFVAQHPRMGDRLREVEPDF